MSYKQATTTTRSRKREMAFPCGHLPAFLLVTSTPRLASRPHTRLGAPRLNGSVDATHTGVGAFYATNCRGPPAQPLASTPYTAVGCRHILPTLSIHDPPPHPAGPPKYRTPDKVTRHPPHTPDMGSQRPIGRRASPSTGRVKKFSSGETIGIMTAASAHWAEYRGRSTGDKKSRMEAVMLKAFIDATPAAEQEVARSRSIKSLDKKFKNVRTRYNDACEDLQRMGLSADEEDDILLKFGGCVLFGLCRSAFKSCPVSAQVSARDPVLLGSGRPLPLLRKAQNHAEWQQEKESPTTWKS